MSEEEEGARSTWLRHAYTQQNLRAFEKAAKKKLDELVRRSSESQDPSVLRVAKEYAHYRALVALFSDGKHSLEAGNRA